MKGILADNNIEGHLQVVLFLLASDPWKEVWDSLDLEVYSFRELGLKSTTPDNILWKACQEKEILLITANRNRAGEDSLEETLEQFNIAESLPVITIGTVEKVLLNKTYREKVAERLLEVLFDIDNLRGTGRLYIP